MACTLIEVILAKHQSSREPKIVSFLDFSNNTDVIIANLPISNIKDLKGKNVGVEINLLGVFMLSRALELNNMTLNDVRIIPMNQASQELAFQKKDIAAAVIYPPVLNRLMRTSKAKILFSSTDIAREVIDVLVFDSNIIRTRKQETTNILKIWGKTLLYVKQNVGESYKIMAKKEQITPEEFHESLKGLEFLPLAEQTELFNKSALIKKNINKVFEVLKYTKQIKGELKADDLLDASIINDLLKTQQGTL